MKNAFWAYWLILLGILIVVIMLLVQNLTSASTQDYYLLKEITDASLVDAVDYTYYRTYGEIKINKEKFYESFIRRFSETASLSTTYTISFYGVYEAPPKVSVEVKSRSNSFTIVGDETSFDMVDRIDTILEGNPYEEFGSSYNYNGGSNISNPTGGTTGGKTVVPEEVVTPTKSNDTVACSDTPESKELAGKRGTPVYNYMPMYKTVSDMSSGNVVTKINPGDIFQIIGSTGKYWQVKYYSDCGWINSDYAFISAIDYLGDVADINITNASSSIFKIGGVNIPNVTGKQLYSNEYRSFVPIAWIFAQNVRTAALNAKANGDTLIINDAYRPHTVGNYVNKQISNYFKKNPNAEKKAFNNVSRGWFFSTGVSRHNTGCAVDVSLRGASMPTDMHDLRFEAIKYYPVVDSARNSFTNYASTMTNDAYKLGDYFKNISGVRDLPSEWWHFENMTCNSTVLSVSDANGPDFWYAVS